MSSTSIIIMGGEVELQAAGADGTKRVEILAYSGGPMRVAGFGDVVLNLAGMDLPQQLPLLADHNPALDRTVGSARPTIQNHRLVASGRIITSGTTAEQLIQLARAGVPIAASIGAEPIERSFIKPGDKVTVNGRTFTAGAAGLTFVNKSRLKEISLVSIGADSGATATIAAQGNQMSEPTTVTTTTPDPIADERQRTTSIVQAAAKYAGRLPAEKLASIQASAIGDNWTSDKLELELIRAARPVAAPSAFIRSTMAPSTDILGAAVALHAGRPDIAEKRFGATVAQQAAELRCHSLVDLCAAALRADCRDVPSDRNDMIRAAFSSMSLPVALGNYAEKSAADAFAETPAIWRALARRRTVSTFHEHKIARVLLVGNFEKVPPGGELKHGVLKETTAAIQADTTGMFLGLTRQAVINDDLGAFSDTASAIGRAGARTMNDDFATMLLDNTGSFFGVGNSNLLSGASSALSASALESALSTMAKKTDSEGRNVDLRARSLLVCPEIDHTARALLNSQTMQQYVSSGSPTKPMGNPLASLALDLYVEPRLSNTTFHASASTTAWYIFSAVNDGAINVALLSGRDTPVIEQVDLPSNVLGIGFRGYIDYGFALGEHLAALKSAGA